MTEDQQLLHRYTHEHSAEAMDEIVRRYRDMVYSSAMRQVRDPHLAEDVAQAVFIVLAKKASTIRQGVALGGWLLAVTRRASLNAMKKRSIQQRHERAAAKPESKAEETAAWEQVDPVLDSAMGQLPNKERDAVVLRFFQDKSFAQVGAELGLSEEAARKRVGRAIERLRETLANQGVSVGAAVLGTTIAANAVQAAPIGVIVSAATTSAGAAEVAKGVISMMAWAKAKFAAAAAAAVILIGGVAVVATTNVQEAAAPPPPATQVAAAPQAPIPFDENAAREAIMARFQMIQNLSVSYRTETVFTPPRASTLPGVGPTTNVVAGGTFAFTLTSGGTLEVDSQLFRLGDRYRIETFVQRQAGLQSKNTTAFSGDRTESLTVQTRQGQLDYTGSIGPPRIDGSELVEWTLGLGTSRNAMPRLSLGDILAMEIKPAPNSRVVARQTDDTKEITEWEFRPDMGYAISAYRVIVQPETRPFIESIGEDYRSVQGVMLPYTVRSRNTAPINGEWTERQRAVATIKEYKLNDTQNNEAFYRIRWPEGTRVTDRTSNAQFVADVDGRLMGQDEVEFRKYRDRVRAATPLPDPVGVFTAPVVGLVISESRRSASANIVNLDQATVIDRPALAQVANPTSPEGRVQYAEATRVQRQRMKDEGNDLAFVHMPDRPPPETGWAIGAIDGFFAKLPAGAWDNPDASAIVSALKADDPGMRLRVSTDVFFLLGTEVQLPVVMAYRTRDNKIGMFRITKLDATGVPRMTVDVRRFNP